MKSTRKEWVNELPFDCSQWHEWFAWRPVRAFEADEKHYRWVWLDVVERKVDTNFSIGYGTSIYKKYRLKTI